MTQQEAYEEYAAALKQSSEDTDVAFKAQYVARASSERADKALCSLKAAIRGVKVADFFEGVDG